MKIKTSIACIFFLSAVLALLPAAGQADTGTYRITDYQVKLTPKSDGSVEIRYSQTWSVTGGHIPWITVGTPNSAFDILKGETKGNARKIRNDSQGSWSGVRIDLDKDYRSGETFQVSFALVQRGLFYAKGDKYCMGFTPGWYDRAMIDNLQVEVFFYADINTVTASPKPTETQGQSMIWKQGQLKRGQKFTLNVSFPKTFLPKGLPEVKYKRSTSWSGWLCFLVFIVFIIIVVTSNVRRVMGKGYTGGSIFTGGSRGSGGGISSGGGGGFGGGGFSCACACAGCACACACAGGGAAGCDRKLLYRCPLCRDCAQKEHCPLWVGETT